MRFAGLSALRALFAAFLLMVPAVQATASPELMRVCTQRYAAWVNTCDTSLRPKPKAGVIATHEGEWCAPTPQTVANLKTHLFAIDQSCEALTPEEKTRVAALVGQTLRMLSRVSACPAPSAPITPPPAATVSVSLPPASAPHPGKAKPNTPIKAVVASPPPPHVQVAAVPPRAQRKEMVAGPAAQAMPPPMPAVMTPPLPPPKPPIKMAVAEPSFPAGTKRARNGALPLTDGRNAAASETRHIARPETEPMTTDSECLFVRQTHPGSYVIDTSRCGSKRVQATVEFYQANGAFSCVRQMIERDVAIVGAEARAPEINFQCIAGTAGCSPELLEQMFPECRNG